MMKIPFYIHNKLFTVQDIPEKNGVGDTWNIALQFGLGAYAFNSTGCSLPYYIIRFKFERIQGFYSDNEIVIGVCRDKKLTWQDDKLQVLTEVRE